MTRLLALAGLMAILVAFPVAAQTPPVDEHHPGGAAAPAPKGDQPAPQTPAPPGSAMSMDQCPMMGAQASAGDKAEHRQGMMSRMMAMMTGRKDERRQMAQAGGMCLHNQAMPMAPPSPAAPPAAPTQEH